MNLPTGPLAKVVVLVLDSFAARMVLPCEAELDGWGQAKTGFFQCFFWRDWIVMVIVVPRLEQTCVAYGHHV